eukprot:882578-Prymnesium_polylepis.1
MQVEQRKTMNVSTLHSSSVLRLVYRQKSELAATPQNRRALPASRASTSTALAALAKYTIAVVARHWTRSTAEGAGTRTITTLLTTSISDELSTYERMADDRESSEGAIAPVEVRADLPELA